MEEKIIELCKEYGFMVYDEAFTDHRRPDQRAVSALTEAYKAGEQSRLNK